MVNFILCAVNLSSPFSGLSRYLYAVYLASVKRAEDSVIKEEREEQQRLEKRNAERLLKVQAEEDRVIQLLAQTRACSQKNVTGYHPCRRPLQISSI